MNLAKLIPQIKLRVLLPCIAWGAVCVGTHRPVWALVAGAWVIAIGVAVMDGRKIR